ncbi:MAG: slipin family protein [Proteobacteria bacterium]|nr:slipin family protein [Pseudomonadota bacterium]
MLGFLESPLLIVLVVAVLLLVAGLRIANEYERAVILRLGRLVGTRGPGLYYVIPMIEQQTVIDQRVVTVAVESQEAITKDNVPVKVDAVVWYRVTDSTKSVIEVQNVSVAVTQTALTLLRNGIGRHSLDDLLKEKDKLSEELRTQIDLATEPWGIEVQRVEMKDVVIPASMQRAMAQEAEALREKRARIIKAEAELEAAQRLKDAAEVIMQCPAGLELRRMQMITEVGAEQNTTTIVMMPSEFVSMASAISKLAGNQKT